VKEVLGGCDCHQYDAVSLLCARTRGTDKGHSRGKGTFSLAGQGALHPSRSLADLRAVERQHWQRCLDTSRERATKKREGGSGGQNNAVSQATQRG
jgi:hypothetical protein